MQLKECMFWKDILKFYHHISATDNLGLKKNYLTSLNLTFLLLNMI